MRVGEKNILLVVFILAISLSFVSAGFFEEIFGRMTGNAMENPFNCIDGDGGINPFIPGNISWTSWYGRAFTIEDKCKDSSSLWEYSCDETGNLRYLVKTITCEFGCNSDNSIGKCNSNPNGNKNNSRTCLCACSDTNNVRYVNTTSTQMASICKDSDGENPFTRGFYLSASGQEIIMNSSESCNNENSVNEAYCNNNNTLLFKTIDCPNGCLNGACLELTAQNQSCLDSDYGIDIYKKGSVEYSVFDSSGIASMKKIEDRCSGKYIFEAICSSSMINGKLSYNGGYRSHSCANGCLDGACLAEPNNYCAETDLGENYFVGGQLNSTSSGMVWDSCITKNSLKEYSCKKEGEMWYASETQYLCPYECIEGNYGDFCVSLSQNYSCTDSDGLDYSNKGFTNSFKPTPHSSSSEVPINGLYYKINEDKCKNSSTLNEAYFDYKVYNLEWQWQTPGKSYATTFSNFKEYHCPNGCLNGACI
jgi:hypothetical protein